MDTRTADRLIVKAAYRWVNAARDTKVEQAEASAELRAFGIVAADVLQICTAPFGFELAIREATAQHPLVVDRAHTRDRAAQIRAEWEITITADVLVRLH